MGRRLLVAKVKRDQQDIGQDRERAESTDISEPFQGQMLQSEEVFKLPLKRLHGGFAQREDLTDAGVLIELGSFTPLGRSIFLTLMGASKVTSRSSQFL